MLIEEWILVGMVIVSFSVVMGAIVVFLHMLYNKKKGRL